MISPLSNKIRNRINLTLFIITIFILGGCENDSNVAFHSSRDVSALGWGPKDSLNWPIEWQDSIHAYNMDVEVRHDNSYPYQNLGLEICLAKGDTLIIKDTLNLSLTSPIGDWQGSGWGSLYQEQYPYNRVTFPYPGNYTLTVRPYMADWNLKGIYSVGIKISKHQ